MAAKSRLTKKTVTPFLNSLVRLSGADAGQEQNFSAVSIVPL